jgi:Cu2+-exporting ATPase
MGTPEVTNLADHPRLAVEVAAALAAASSHPLAMALAQGARDAGIQPADLTEVQEVPGYGVQGMWRGQQVRLGRAVWIGAEALDQTATYLAAGDGKPRAFTFEDRVRVGAAEAIAALKAQGKSIRLISGDVEGAVANLARRLGITDWTSGALPAEKVSLVRSLTLAGHRVLMVGDGLNDTAALAAAHVSISPATALDAARTASDIVLLGQDMAPIGDATRIARQATRRIVENFGISAAYNVIAVPLALVGSATPLAAALAMSLSSITVSLNALRLK